MDILSIPSRWVRDFARHVRNFNYEFDDDNDLLIASVKFDNYVEVHAPDGLGWTRHKNLVTTEGKNHMLDVVLHGASAVSTWYIAPSSGNVEPSATWTHAGATAYHTVATELSSAQVSPSTRQTFDEVAASAGSTNNTASPSIITTLVDNITVYGVGLCSLPTRQSVAAGTLLAAAKYSTARSLPTTGDNLGIKWTLNL